MNETDTKRLQNVLDYIKNELVKDMYLKNGETYRKIIDINVEDGEVVIDFYEGSGAGCMIVKPEEIVREYEHEEIQLWHGTWEPVRIWVDGCTVDEWDTIRSY